MTKEEVLQAIQDIEDSRFDDQVAHEKEDTLHEKFIRFIALRKDEPGEIARMILTTKDISFARWCA